MNSIKLSDLVTGKLTGQPVPFSLIGLPYRHSSDLNNIRRHRTINQNDLFKIVGTATYNNIAHLDYVKEGEGLYDCYYTPLENLIVSGAIIADIPAPDNVSDNPQTIEGVTPNLESQPYKTLISEQPAQPVDFEKEKEKFTNTLDRLSQIQPIPAEYKRQTVELDNKGYYGIPHDKPEPAPAQSEAEPEPDRVPMLVWGNSYLQEALIRELEARGVKRFPFDITNLEGILLTITDGKVAAVSALTPRKALIPKAKYRLPENYEAAINHMIAESKRQKEKQQEAQTKYPPEIKHSRLGGRLFPIRFYQHYIEVIAKYGVKVVVTPLTIKQVITIGEFSAEETRIEAKQCTGKNIKFIFSNHAGFSYDGFGISGITRSEIDAILKLHTDYLKQHEQKSQD